MSLCFGVAGSGTLTAGHSEVAYHRDAGVLMPEAPVMWRIESCSSDFEVSLDPKRLSVTARVMLGLEEDGPLPGWNIDDLRPVPTKAGVVNGLAALISVAIQADRYKSQPRVLAASGLEDQCYRQAVFLLAAEAFLRPLSRAAAIHSERPAIDRLCEWLRANLYSPLTLTDFERLSGLAARTLQVSFRKRFGMSPMAWFREQRLLAARSMLEHMRGTDSEAPLQAVTASCGFVSVADLRRRYRARFGESPAVPPGPAE